MSAHLRGAPLHITRKKHVTVQKTASIFAASALALAVAGAAQAYTIEAGDTTANIYGYAKLDLIYDVDAKLGNSVGHGNIYLDGQPVS